MFVGHTLIVGYTAQTASEGQPLLLQSPQIGMDSPVFTRGSLEDEGQRLKACEDNLRRYTSSPWQVDWSARPCMRSIIAWRPSPTFSFSREPFRVRTPEH